MKAGVDVRRRGAILEVTLDRPKVNAIDIEASQAMAEAFAMLRDDDDLRVAFESGANQITGGSIAVKDKATFTNWIKTYGPEKIILGADALDEKVAVSGWQEESKEELLPFIKSYQKKGIQYVICTDISKDGMLEGPSFSLYKKILMSVRADLSAGKAGSRTETNVHLSTRRKDSLGSAVEDHVVPSLKLIASGGISTFEELPRLAEIGCEGVIIGKAIYENRIGLKQLEDYILSA